MLCLKKKKEVKLENFKSEPKCFKNMKSMSQNVKMVIVKLKKVNIQLILSLLLFFIIIPIFLLFVV